MRAYVQSLSQGAAKIDARCRSRKIRVAKGHLACSLVVADIEMAFDGGAFGGRIDADVALEFCIRFPDSRIKGKRPGERSVPGDWTIRHERADIVDAQIF